MYAQMPQQQQPGMVYGVPSPILSAPPAQMMAANLATLPGVVIKQTTTAMAVAAAVLDLPFEPAQSFSVHVMPPGVHAARVQGAADTWNPSLPEIEALPRALFVQENSSCAARVILSVVGGLNLRALTLHFLGGAGEQYTAVRPCKLGGCCCCPLEMNLLGPGGSPVGSVVEDFDGYCVPCVQQCCGCVFRHKVLLGPQREHRYTLQTGLCCFGRVNNCCGATCCRPNLIMDIQDTEGKLVSTVQKTFGGGGRGCDAACCEAMVRCTTDLDNYVLEFPQDASADERALLVTAVLSHDYALFSRTGGDNNGDSSS